MKNKNMALTISRLFFALLAFSALVTEVATAVERGTFTAPNFFSYFTVQTNFIAVLVLIVGALDSYKASTLPSSSSLLAQLRGATTLYMVVVGIVFSILLANLDAELTAVPWDNTVLHYIMPIYIVLDWLVDRPHHRVTTSKAMIWISFPVLYVVYSLIRGHLVDWYPYPFLNPNIGGMMKVLITCVVIGLLGAALAYAIARSTGRKNINTNERRS